MMKKIVSILLVTGVLFSFTGCSVRFEVDHKNNSSYMEEVASINKSVPYNNEGKIDIEINYGDINIIGYDGNEVVVTGTGNGGDKNMTVKSDGEKITIKDTSNGSISINLFGNNGVNNGTKVDIKIPYSFAGDLDFSYGAGDTYINDVKCKTLKVEGGAATLDIENIVFEKLDLTAGVGETNIILKEKCGDINISGGVGDITVDLAEVGGNLTFEGGVGDAKIRIPENSPVYFDSDAGVGTTKLTAKTSGENLYKFKLSLGVGDVKVFN